MNEMSQAAYLNTASTYQNIQTKQKDDKTSAVQTQSSDGKKEVKGAGTYGNPKLSDKALDYYNSLKKKYGNLNFVLVSSDKKQEAEMMKGSFARSGSLTVLIDTDKIERMAEDETYRSQIESKISNASSGISQLAARLGQSSSYVTAYGMTMDKSGNASYFAVLDKSLVAQKKRIEKKAEEKKEAKKADAKKAKKEEAEERLEERRTKAEKESSDTVTITADSIESLIKKIQDYEAYSHSNFIQSKAEKYIGQSVDYRL